VGLAHQNGGTRWKMTENLLSMVYYSDPITHKSFCVCGWAYPRGDYYLVFPTLCAEEDYIDNGIVIPLSCITQITKLTRGEHLVFQQTELTIIKGGKDDNI